MGLREAGAASAARTALEVETLEAIRPTPKEEEKMARVSAQLVKRCGEAAQFFGARATPVPVGSLPKGTHLRGADIDIFLLFDTAVPLEQLREEGLKIAKSVVEQGVTRYAEHPYLRGVVEGIDVDIVPAYAVKSAREMKTAVDRTPFHNEFIRERLSSAQRDEVRLIKQFLKGIGAYGAELAVQGFSGYLCELLVVRFGSFAETLQAAASWGEGTALWVEGSTPAEVAASARKDFPEPLVFIDPVDPGRNVASPVSMDNYALFVLAAREYARDPRPTFFFPRPKPKLQPAQVREAVGKRGTRLIGITTRGSEQVDDVWVPQLRKSMRALEKMLVSYGFTVIRCQVYWDPEVLFLFEMNSGLLPAATKHFGPMATHENARDFMEKWSGRPGQLSKVYTEEGRLMVDVAREHTDAAELLREKAGIVSHGKHVAEAFRESFLVMEAEDVAREPYTKDASDFVQPGLPWTF